MIFKLFSENLENWHTRFDDFEWCQMLLALLCLANHAIWLLFNYKHGQDECCRCFSGASHYQFLWAIFWISPVCYCFESLLFYLWRFVCIYIICIKISDWMRQSNMCALKVWEIGVAQTFWSANWCLLSAFELPFQICTWSALMYCAVQQFIKINWRSFKTFVAGWILFMGSLVDEPWFGHLLVLMCRSLAWCVLLDFFCQFWSQTGWGLAWLLTKTKQAISFDQFSSSFSFF